MTAAPETAAVSPADEASAVICLPDCSLPDRSEPTRSRSGSSNRQRVGGVFVRLLPAEQVRLEAEADAAGMSTPAYLRAGRLDADIPARPTRRRRLPETDAKALARNNAELNMIGSNLNQAVRALNEIALAGTGGLATVAHLTRPIQDALEDLRRTLAANRQAVGYDREG